MSALIATQTPSCLDAAHLRRILTDGSPASFHASGTNKEFQEFYKYGNHKSIDTRMPQAMVTMNKEDRKEHVLTFPAWLAPLLPDLMLTPQGLVVHRNKKDRLVFDASFMPSETTITYNSLIDLCKEHTITFARAWHDHLVRIYNLRITFPDEELYTAKDDAAGAFRQPKYHPNIISAKAFIIGPYLFVPTGKTFGDRDSPSNWEPIARARQALSEEYSYGHRDVPPFPEYMDNVRIATPPRPPQPYTPAYQDKFNPGISFQTDSMGRHPVTYHMHVDDNLHAAVGIAGIRWAMRCSIAGIIGVLGDNEPDLRSEQPDMEKFLKDEVSYERRQLGLIVNTRTLDVTIPPDKREETIDMLIEWTAKSHFYLREAAELLGTLISLCRVCPWGSFLFLNLLHSMHHLMQRNAERLWYSPDFAQMVICWDEARTHPTSSAKYRFWSKRVARVIWDCRSATFISREVCDELHFLLHVFRHPEIYKWQSPIRFLIPAKGDYHVYQDSCNEDAGGFCQSLTFYWYLRWPEDIYHRTSTFSEKGDSSTYISINMLEYSAMIIGLAATILAWEALPATHRPATPIVLLWTDNTTARSWTHKMAGLSRSHPQGRALARLFAHLLMFSTVGIEANHVAGTANVIADHLSRLRLDNQYTHFTYRFLVQKYPWLRKCHRFHPSRELLSLLYSSLQIGCSQLPTTRVPLGRLAAEKTTSSTPSSHI